MTLHGALIQPPEDFSFLHYFSQTVYLRDICFANETCHAATTGRAHLLNISPYTGCLRRKYSAFNQISALIDCVNKFDVPQQRLDSRCYDVLLEVKGVFNFEPLTLGGQSGLAHLESISLVQRMSMVLVE
jgi:hypothetical protein